MRHSEAGKCRRITPWTKKAVTQDGVPKGIWLENGPGFMAKEVDRGTWDQGVLLNLSRLIPKWGRFTVNQLFPETFCKEGAQCTTGRQFV